MKMTKLAKMVLKRTNEKQGWKITEAVADKILVELAIKEKEDLMKVIEELVKYEKLIEIEYILPNLEYRIKSFLLPKETKIL